MTWITESVAGRRDATPAGDRLAQLWQRPGILGMPGAHDPMAGLLARAAGFEALYLSGAALSASLGLPDLGVITLDELCQRTRAIWRATALPILVDGDTGYGEALNVMRLVGELEDAGAAAVQLEDQILPKKCGHLSDKRLAAPEAMAEKIAAARRQRRHLRILARTDALASEGEAAALARLKLYIKAGADALFPEALTSAEQFKRFAAELKVPLLANMTEFGRTPYLSAADFESYGFKMVIWPVSSLRVAAHAMAAFFADLKRDGRQGEWVERMQTRRDLYQTIGYHDYEALDSSIAKSVLPGDNRG